MVRVGTGIVIGRMTTCAGVGGVGIVAVVAGVAITGNGYVCACKRIDRVVVEGRRRPGSLAMAIGATGRELRCRVVRVGRSSVVRRVASVAGIGCIVVIAVVASRTVTGNGGVRTLQYVVIVVHRERSRFPTRVGGMAGRAVGR